MARRLFFVHMLPVIEFKKNYLFPSDSVDYSKRFDIQGTLTSGVLERLANIWIRNNLLNLLFEFLPIKGIKMFDAFLESIARNNPYHALSSLKNSSETGSMAPPS